MPCIGAVTRLELKNYRNFRSARLECDAAFVVLTGANGVGKTNIIEALSSLSPGRGMRGAPSSECVPFGTELQWSCSALVSRQGLKSEIRVIGDNAGRQVSIDRDVLRNVSKLRSFVRLTWLSPSMDGLLNGPASDRRKFWDGFVANLDPDHGTRVRSFRKLMRERLQVLRWRASDDNWLTPIEQQIAELGVAITYSRLEALRLVSGVTEELADTLGNTFLSITAGIDGDLIAEATQQAAVDVELQYIQQLAQNRAQDADSGMMSYGPHHQDLVVWSRKSGHQARQCSTGQRKSMLMVLVLAQSIIVQRQAVGTASVLLLDEAAAHLDTTRRQALFDLLGKSGSQVWFTGTESEIFSRLPCEATHFAVGSDDGFCHACY